MQLQNKYELVINMKTAKALGLVSSALAACDRRRGDRLRQFRRTPWRSRKVTLRGSDLNAATAEWPASNPIGLRKRMRDNSALRDWPAGLYHDGRSRRRGGVGSSAAGTETVGVPTLRSRLFRKYVSLFVLAVGSALLASGVVEVWSSYRDHTAWLIRIQRAQAEAAAAKIGQFIGQIEAQLGWTDAIRLGRGASGGAAGRRTAHCCAWCLRSWSSRASIPPGTSSCMSRG